MGIGAIFSFLTSPAGRMAILALAFVGWTVYQRHDAAVAARETCNAEFFKAQVAEKERQLEAARQAAEEARNRADTTAEELAKSKEQADALRKQLTDVPDIPDDVRRQLLNIR